MTIKDLFDQAVARHPDNVALRWKCAGAWLTLSYRQLQARVWRTAETLARAGARPGDRVGLFLENGPEWFEMYLATVGLGCIATPCDAKLKEQEVAHILRDSGAKILLCGAGQYSAIKYIEDSLPELRRVILLEGAGVNPVSSRKTEYADYAAFCAQAAQASTSGAAYRAHSPKDDDLASLIYTSGTTGRQKGAMLTHGNFTADVLLACQAIQIYTTDKFLLVLPLHHAFAFTCNLLLPLHNGCEIALVESLKTVGENLREVSPTVLIGVPLLMEKLYNRIWSNLKANQIGYTLYRIGLKGIVRRKILEKLGGKLRLMVTGGAPCPATLLQSFGALGLPIIEGYGLTETAPILTLNTPDAPRPGSVGKPLPGVDIKIMDPNPDGVGEIAARGPVVMKGYYKNPGATEEVMRDGWFLTGDLGFIAADGYITITGRKKSLIVNREGKNIYPEEVENEIAGNPFIQEAMVLGYHAAGGDKGERVGAIVVPNQEALDAHANKAGKNLSDRELTEFVCEQVRTQCRNLAEYKRPRRIQVRFEEFQKTSTQKIKRYLYALDTAGGDE